MIRRCLQIFLTLGWLLLAGIPVVGAMPVEVLRNDGLPLRGEAQIAGKGTDARLVLTVATGAEPGEVVYRLAREEVLAVHPFPDDPRVTAPDDSEALWSAYGPLVSWVDPATARLLIPVVAARRQSGDAFGALVAARALQTVLADDADATHLLQRHELRTLRQLARWEEVAALSAALRAAESFPPADMLAWSAGAEAAWARDDLISARRLALGPLAFTATDGPDPERARALAVAILVAWTEVRMPAVETLAARMAAEGWSWPRDMETPEGLPGTAPWLFPGRDDAMELVGE